MQSFKIVAFLLLGYFWLVEEKEKDLLILIATLATTEVSVGAVAKADQHHNHHITSTIESTREKVKGKVDDRWKVMKCHILGRMVERRWLAIFARKSYFCVTYGSYSSPMLKLLFYCRFYYESVHVEKVALVFVEPMEEEKEAGKSGK